MKKLKNKHRFKEITKILLKHKIHKKITPISVRETLEELGPTFVKIGQILSTREDMIPQEYCLEFAKLKENVAPLPFSTISEVIETELNTSIDNVFSYIDENPIGSASIGQVHTAVLKNGTKVVIKVMRPHIFEIVVEDFNILNKAVKYLNLFTDLDDVVDLNIIFSETFEAMKKEMNFLNELNNINLFKLSLEGINYIKLPTAYEQYTTEHVLVMEYIEGCKINDIASLDYNGYDKKEICAKLMDNFIYQVVDKGVFHADPHSGNIMISNGKIVWLDLGMVGILSKRDQQLYKKAILAVISNDVSEMKNIILTIGVKKGEINHAKLYQDIEILLYKYFDMNVADIDMGQFFQELMTVARANNISLPKGLTLLGRSIIILQKVAASLDPEINLLEMFSKHVKDNYKNDLDIFLKTKDVITKIYKSASKSTEIPSQLYDLLNLTIKGQKHSNVEIVNLSENINKGSKIANRLILGIIVASLIFSVGIVLASIIFNSQEVWIRVVSLIIVASTLLVILILFIVIVIMIIKDRKKKQ